MTKPNPYLTPKPCPPSKRDADVLALVFLLVCCVLGIGAAVTAYVLGSRLGVLTSGVGLMGLVGVVAMIRTGGKR